MLVVLDYPSPKLSPNYRLHHFAAAAVKKAARQNAHWMAKQAGFTRLDTPRAVVRVTIHPPDKRKRDLDNIQASCKAHLDGIRDVIGIDDSKWRLEWAPEFGAVVKGGAVIIEVEGLTE